MSKGKICIFAFTFILVMFISFSSAFVLQSQGRNGVMGMATGINSQGILPGLLGPSMSIPLDPVTSGLGAIPAAGMSMSPILVDVISPAAFGLINDPLVAMNGMNPLAPAAGTPVSLMRSAPLAPLMFTLNNPSMISQGVLPYLNMGISPILGIGMSPIMQMPMSNPIMGVSSQMIMPSPMMVMGGPVPGMTDPRMMMPVPMMSIPGPMMGMPNPMMNPMMGMPNPMMGMPWPMMDMHDPMMSMPAPMMNMPGPLMNLPIISPFHQIPQTLPAPIPTTTLTRSANIVIVPLTGDSCTFCHGDLIRMTDLGFPEFYIDPDLVAAETGMPATCVDCHLGNPDDFTVDGAHVGLLGLLVMRNQYRDITRRKDVVGPEYDLVRSIQSIRAGNTNDPRFRLRVQNPFHMLLWHDRNLTTASWNPDISLQTCGRCHPAQVAEFSTTEMGLVQTMSQYIPWIAPSVPGGLGTHLSIAPQSCGLWTAATANSDPAATIINTNDVFTEDNRLLYNSTSTRIANQFLDPRYPETSADPLTRLQALANQRNCNKCHPGCLDCHYAPFEENIPAAMGPGVKPAGTHTIAGRPLVMSCMGMGRGQFCHGGAIERRRGDGYIKGAFAQVPPPSLLTTETQTYLNTPDIHYNGDLLPENATCVDCHARLAMGGGPPGIHGDMNRNPEPDRCAVCHPASVAAYLTGTHRNLTCGACHTPKIVGYAFNLWSPGSRFGISPNPLDRHERYAVNAMTPVLLIDENGMWAPYHVVPHISTHIDPLYLLVNNYLSPRILWRNQPDIGIIRQHPSKDGVAITGSYNGPLFGLDEGQVMVWLNIDKLAHSNTSMISALPPRTCIDCHTPDGTQRSPASFAWNGDPTLIYQDLYMGSFDIVADGLGLHIENLIGSTVAGTPSTALDPMRGKWGVPGSFIIPPAIGPAVGHPSGVI